MTVLSVLPTSEDLKIFFFLHRYGYFVRTIPSFLHEGHGEIDFQFVRNSLGYRH